MKFSVKDIVLIIAVIYGILFLERSLSAYKEKSYSEDYKESKKEFEFKIKELEDEKFKDSVIIWSADRAKRDSIRAAINPR